MKCCCAVGHSDIPVAMTDYVRNELKREILNAIKDGYSHFICGFAGISDLYFSKIILELKKEGFNLTLEAAIPHRKKLETYNDETKKMLLLCDVQYISSEAFHKGCYIERNIYMVNKSERLIAVFDGRKKGGTAFTMLYAETTRRELRTIMI